ncbi:glycine betaine/proline transport system permease protein [Mumia flava]|uniref:Glycine betaine/proline transport system permease protein n=1 Tax=Mumia flava TaxID=1348852 RepID=A0A0B2BLI1_9ACTN|nr:ABC transporter permease subunit [Mumia flava]PJJ56390.1 glycine betaine/proline transport system permease protein [Mumia flava]
MTILAENVEGTFIPRINVGDWFTDLFDWITDNFSGFFSTVSDMIEGSVDGIITVLDTPGPVLMAVVFALLAWLAHGWKLALGSLLGLLFIISVDQWTNAMETLALVAVATVIALVIGIPLGIWASRSPRVSAVVKPVMDLLQTMPAFVWLIPVVTLFSIGEAAGVVATVIFCVAPAVRLTELGIRQVDSEVVEAGQAFGSSSGQILRGIQIPLAMPTIMAGVNQVIMLALSMAVIAGLVGAGGLGGEVTSSIATLDLGLGFEAGLSVVALAIYLDRVTASIGQNRGQRPNALSVLKERYRSARAMASSAGTS